MSQAKTTTEMALLMKRNALLVGGFVVIAGVLVVVAILWMSGNTPVSRRR